MSVSSAPRTASDEEKGRRLPEKAWVFGLLIGVAIWVSTGQLAVGIGVGTAFAFALMRDASTPSKTDSEGRQEGGADDATSS